MARTGKPAGNKRTSFGKRTEAEKSFRDQRRSRPGNRNDSKKRSGPKRFFSTGKSSSSPFGSEKPRGEGHFTKRNESDRPFKKKPDPRFRGEGDSSSPRANRFSPPGNFSKPRFGNDKPQGEGNSSFGRTSASGPFRESKDPKSFSRKSDVDKNPSFGDKGFSRKKLEGNFSSPFGRHKSQDQRFSKPVGRKNEEGDRFSKFKKEERPIRAKPTGNFKYEEVGREKKDKKPFPSKGKRSFEPLENQSKKSETPEIPAKEIDGGLIRLNKFMANSGVGSRREADEYIKMGLVTVNGETVTEMGHKVKLTDDVRYEGRKLKAEPLVYVLLNKPKGFITTTDDPEERKTVMDLVASACKERIYPVGRLDRNTTGLLLLTNDGDLADKLTHPSYKAKKIYKVELDRALTKNDFQKILDGVYFEEGRAIVDDLAIVSDDGKEIGIEIHIGWNRIVRRIFEALGYQIERLDRVMYAGLDKKDLGRGQWRFLKPEEIVRLKHFQG